MKVGLGLIILKFIVTIVRELGGSHGSPDGTRLSNLTTPNQTLFLMLCFILSWILFKPSGLHM